MATKAELQAILDCDNKPFIQAMSQAVQKANKAGKDIEKSFSFQGMMGKAGGALAGVLGAGAVINFTKSVIDMGGELQDASDKLNLSTDALQGLGFAFSQSGASQEVFEKGMVKLNETISDARNGNEKLLATFGRMGVSFNDLQEKSPDEVLLLIADAAKDANNPTQALSDIMELLGKSGQKMAAGLKQGSEGIKSLADGASKLTENEIKALDEAGDRLAATWLRVKVALAKALTVPEEERYKKMGIDFIPNFQPGQKVNNAPLPGDTGFKGEQEVARSRAKNAREIFDNWNDQLEASSEKEKKLAKESADFQAEDLKRKGEMILEIQAIEAKTFQIEQDAARDQMDTQQLLVSLEKERAQWVSRAVGYERDRFQLHQKEAAMARQEAARLTAQINQVKISGPKTGAQAMFEQQAEGMREKMMKESGLGIYSGSRRGSSNWVFQQPVGLRSSGGLQTGRLQPSGGVGGDAYGLVRRGDAARAKRAAKEMDTTTTVQGAITATAENTAAMVKLWGGTGRRK